MTTPTETIIDHLEAVRDAFTLAPGPSAAWLLLLKSCPAISASMSQNTFRATAPVVLGTAARLVTPAPPPPPEAPRTFQHWTVTTDRKGYIRLQRKVSGESVSIYIGRTWDEAKARARVEARAVKATTHAVASQ